MLTVKPFVIGLQDQNTFKLTDDGCNPRPRDLMLSIAFWVLKTRYTDNRLVRTTYSSVHTSQLQKNESFSHFYF